MQHKKPHTFSPLVLTIHRVLFLRGGDEKLFSAQKKFRVKKVCQIYSIADAISRNLVLKLFLRADTRKKSTK